jgi:hypothetical protein
MEQIKYYEYCIYTIKHSKELNKALFTTREGKFTERNRWTEAKKWLEDAHSKNQNLIVVFAPAEETLWLHSWAILTDINIGEDKSTEYSFKDLTLFAFNDAGGIYKHELVLKNTGNNINDNFIRPYALCKTPYDLIKDYSIDMDNPLEEDEEYIGWLYEDCFGGKSKNEWKTSEGEKNIYTILSEIDKEMENMEPEKKEVEFNKIIRKDARIVKWLKELYNNKCQFPGCEAKVQTKSGEYYVEVAHITSVADGGKSTLDNLLVLCPNHHKEFDLGDREIIERNDKHIEGKLNGKHFDIWFQKNI